MQGFDFECWAQDTQNGKIAFFGRFQSLTVSVRDATETYLELGQRIPIYLNGEIQIAWVLEQGLVDMSFIVRTFGVQNIRRDQVISRGPRFHIAFDANAADRVSQTAEDVPNSFTQDLGSASSAARLGARSPQFTNNTPGALPGQEGSSPSSSGRYEMMRCKVDSVSLGVMPGRRVAAVRWEGVCEGITYVPDSLQNFKSGLASSIAGGGNRTALNASDSSTSQATSVPG